MKVDWANTPLALVNLLRGYAILCPTRALQFPSDLPFAQIHEFLLHGILLNPHFATYPPAPQYRQQFWKWAIGHLEAMPMGEDDEIDERLYDQHVALLSRPTLSQAVGSQAPAPSYFTYFWKPIASSEYQSATLVESRTTIESGTTGLKTWRASLVLAQYLIKHPDLVRGRNVLELGSGVGLLGVIIAALQLDQRASLARITLTDVNPEVLARCSANLILPCNESSSHPSLATAQLDWTDALTDSGIPAVQALLQEASADLILGADVVYDPSIISPLVATLRLALVGPGKSAIVALTERNENTLAQFVKAANEALLLEEIEPELEDMKSFWGVADLGDAMPDQRVKIFRLQYKDV